MTNSEQAYPSITIQCKDRAREYCLNLGGFRALEEHMVRKTGKEDFSILEDFDWNSTKIETVCLMMWAGLYTDAKKDVEPFTVERCEDIVSVFSVAECRDLANLSLSRVMSPDQFKKFQEDLERKKENRLSRATDPKNKA